MMQKDSTKSETEPSGLLVRAICFTIRLMADRMAAMMKRLLIIVLVCMWSVLQPVQGNLAQLLQQGGDESAAAMSPRARAKAFSALSVLPADTDSFFALAKLGELLAGEPSGLVYESAAGIDGFALGMSEAAVRDMQRLMPLFQVLGEVESSVADEWAEKATPETSRAIVAQQREAQYRAGEMLVQATQDYHLAPVYMVLSCKPGGESLLQQLSVLPLMVPVEADGPLVLMARGSSRGFYLRGDSLDLSKANLAPEHEEAIARNLQNARLYIMAEVLGDKLVLVICSNLDEVKLPRRAAQSLLGTDKMAPFDALMQRDALAVGSCSPAVVNMCEELNICAYRGAASFLKGVFRHLSADNAMMAPAAAAVEQMMQQIVAFMPAHQVSEQLMAWRDADSIYVQLVSDAAGQSFAPGVLAHESLAQSADTAFYLESTALHGLPEVDVASLLQNIECVQQAYLQTLRPEYAAEESASFHQLQKNRPALEKLAAGLQDVAGALGDNVTLLVRELAEEKPACLSLRAEVADAVLLDEGCAQLQEAAKELELPELMKDGGTLQVQQQKNVVLLSTGAGLELAAPQGGASVPGGAVFSLNVPALARVLARAGHDEADAVAWLAAWVEKVQGAVTIRGERVYATLRLKLNHQD